MSDTAEPDTCPARTLHAGYEVTCDREANHAGVHLGKSIGDDGTELHQWPDSESLGNDQGPVDELPVWYGVMPIGQIVRVGYRDERDRFEGELTGCVLDDHEQPAAIRVQGAERVALIPWDNIAVLSWELGQ